jgi:hypothetical protein
MSKELLISNLANVGFELAAPPHETDKQLRLTGRVNKTRSASWLLAIELLEIEASLRSWGLDISKHHFVPKPLIELVTSGAEPANGTHVLFSWRVIFQGDALASHYGAIAETLARVQQPRSELMEVPLSAPPNRNALKNGKGAQGVLTPRVGQMYRGDG